MICAAKGSNGSSSIAVEEGGHCKKVSKVRLVKYIAFWVAADILPYYSHCTAPPPSRCNGNCTSQCSQCNAKSCTGGAVYAVHQCGNDGVQCGEMRLQEKS